MMGFTFNENVGGFTFFGGVGEQLLTFIFTVKCFGRGHFLFFVMAT